MEIFVKTIFFLVFSAIRVVHCGIRDSFSLVPLQFKFYGIAPEYIDPAPKELCQVRWANGAIANLGNTLTASDIDKPPTVYWSCDKREKYSVFLIDLDPLGMDTRLGSESRLWLVANITNCNWDHAETVFDYLPPTPIEGTGPHRYVVLVYKQPATLFYEEPFERSDVIDHRLYTSVKKDALKYGLGRPVCGNIFLGTWDEQVQRTIASLKQPFPAYVYRSLHGAGLLSQFT